MNLLETGAVRAARALITKAEHAVIDVQNAIDGATHMVPLEDEARNKIAIETTLTALQLARRTLDVLS